MEKVYCKDCRNVPRSGVDLYEMNCWGSQEQYDGHWWYAESDLFRPMMRMDIENNNNDCPHYRERQKNKTTKYLEFLFYTTAVLFVVVAICALGGVWR